MGIEDLAKKAKEALSSDQVEEISDKVLDAAENLANKATGGKFADKVEDVKETLDKKIGE